MANVIELNSINKIYGTTYKTQVLWDVDLAIEEGAFASIIGQSGSGKSTLLNIIGTLQRPTSGSVMINGIDAAAMSKNALASLRNETIGFVFQFHHLLPEFTALENVLMPARIRSGRVSKETRDRALELMQLMDLEKVKDNNASKMSGGQQQRTSIARALVNNPRIVLADEPTGNLDSDSAEKVYDIMRDINERYNTTFLIITHDRRIAQKADRIIEIKDGRIYLDLPTRLAGKSGEETA